MNNSDTFDIIVIGAGHAGIEAALAGARIGFRTLLVTINLDTIGLMPCNPSIGGPGKGHLVREIDALGGEMARNIDKTHIHNRILNTSKGPAVQALRAQADKKLYQFRMKNTLENTPLLCIKQGMVRKLFFNVDEKDLRSKGADSYPELSISGIELDTGESFFAPTAIVTTGTFLNGKVHIGEENFSAGRLGEFASVGLTDSLLLAGFEIGRLKTGTVPRVNSKQIDFEKMIIQDSSEEPLMFSYFSKPEIVNPQVPCWITYTNEKTHEVIRSNFDRSPLFRGRIQGIGPRYCPSIEDKVKRFGERERHPVFVEPEGINTNEVYLQGLSTSLPIDVQKDMLKTIIGLEHVDIMRPGYAIEYDYVNPIQLLSSLMSKRVKGLFFAGQINGTSGYEEAGAQGLVAGINATALLRGMDPLVLGRTDGYTGVLIDDLVTKGTLEPYRIFTSRVEHRLNIRFDNADDRLCAKGFEYGLLKESDFALFSERKHQRDSVIKQFSSFHVKQTSCAEHLKSRIGKSLHEVLREPDMKIDDVLSELPDVHLGIEQKRRIEIEVKYDGYIKKQEIQIAEIRKMEQFKIPSDLNFFDITNISKESRQKLSDVRPATIAQASGVMGVSPSDITVLIYYIRHLLRK